MLDPRLACICDGILATPHCIQLNMHLPRFVTCMAASITASRGWDACQLACPSFTLAQCALSSKSCQPPSCCRGNSASQQACNCRVKAVSRALPAWLPAFRPPAPGCAPACQRGLQSAPRGPLRVLPRA